jgi:hypothetical protein
MVAVLDEIGQDFEGQGFERDGFPSVAEFVATRIKFIGIESVDHHSNPLLLDDGACHRSMPGAT